MNALRRCRNTIDANNVVLIDVDTYTFNNVIVIDVPEKSRPSKTYIYIDDDDESPNETTCENNASSSGSPDTHFSQENKSPVKLSKGKRTYSGRASNNRNELNLQSDSDSSDDDNCELMEDSSGKLREQWEKASLKRKAELNNDRSSTSSMDARNDFDVNKNKGKCSSKVANFEGECSTPNGYKINCEEKNELVSSSSDEEENEGNELLNVVPAVEDAPVENSIIDQREKLKETEEFKRALEEELAARQLALKIQAEEAQHLRRMQKRKKAESLRILDMERRQKQRVEEIRETQKKDEENMNLKEQYRTEVRQELNQLEITCRDMASLLRGLGIQVGDNLSPSSSQVRVAYKRALLSFHPDRSSGSDMRQQVEAEEKFKLISRMKEKLSL